MKLVNRVIRRICYPFNNSTKTYCKNCKWCKYTKSGFPECFSPEPLSEKMKIAPNHIQYCVNMNFSYGCKHYKRKWWKFNLTKQEG